MTKLALSTHRFIGLSTDTKDTGVPIGSTWHEYDTGLLYITYDGTNWVEKDPNMRRMRIALELILGEEVSTVDSEE